MKKAIVFDMDGTLADFYAVEGWLQKLHNSDPSPYADAAQRYNSMEFARVMNAARAKGYKIYVCSWLSKGSSPKFDRAVKAVKKAWLRARGFDWDGVRIVKYGTPKHEAMRRYGDFQILVDDNAKVRGAWNLGPAIDANNKDFLKELEAAL